MSFIKRWLVEWTPEVRRRKLRQFSASGGPRDGNRQARSRAEAAELRSGVQGSGGGADVARRERSGVVAGVECGAGGALSLAGHLSSGRTGGVSAQSRAARAGARGGTARTGRSSGSAPAAPLLDGDRLRGCERRRRDLRERERAPRRRARVGLRFEFPGRTPWAIEMSP